MIWLRSRESEWLSRGFGCEAVKASGEAVRGLVKSRVELIGEESREKKLAASPLASSLAGFAREGNWRLRSRSPAHASRQLRRLLTVIHSFLIFLQDEFMDVWVYVILKSRIPNLASTVAFLRRYSNPNLSFSEAGYYLASVEFACQFLRQLNEHDYRNKSPLLKHNIVVCEPRRFGKMMTDELPMFDMVLQDVWLPGYELFAVKEWHLDPTRSDF